MAGTVHVVGAGMAGLACAVQGRAMGLRVIVHEAAGQAGGRCRSFHDSALDRTIDNGNHLLLSGNPFVHAFLNRIGAADRLIAPQRSGFPMVDLESGERWCIRPNAGRIPWWLLVPSRGVPGCRLSDFTAALRLARAGPEATVSETLAGVSDAAIRRFWEPFAVAVLNADLQEGMAALLWPVLRETFGRGGAACRPRIAKHGLSAALVDPAVGWLRREGCEVRLRARVAGLDFDESRVVAMGGESPLGNGDIVVLAVPPQVAVRLVPGLTVPTESRSIVNLHYRIDSHAAVPAMVGIVGGTAQWVFHRDDVASVTISAGESVLDVPSDALLECVWPEVRRSLELTDDLPRAGRVIREKRATFAQTPSQVRLRPQTHTQWENLFLAGDWTATGLPATIEGAVRSGVRAAFAAKNVFVST